MGAVLTPGLALDCLCELSADLRAGIVLDRAGARVAGAARLARSAAAVLAALGEAREGQAIRRDGAVFAARGDGSTIVVVCGPRALPALARHDLRLALRDLGARTVEPEAPVSDLPGDLADAVISAAQRGLIAH